MRFKFFFFIAFVHLLNHSKLQAQTDSSARKWPSSDDVIFSIGTTALSNVPSPAKSSLYSPTLATTLYFQQDLGKSGFSVAEGLGFSSHNIRNNLYVWNQNSTTNTNGFTLFNDSVFDKNKLLLTQINVPLEIRWSSKPNKKGNTLRIATGIQAGFVLGSTKKTQFKNGTISKLKKTDDLKAINSFRADLLFRVSYGRFGVYGLYSLRPLFNNMGNQFTPFQIGISFLP